MADRVDRIITIENAHIFYRNFSGKETQYNRAGQMNFCVEIPDDELAEVLKEEGWNIRIRAPREEGDRSFYYLQVTVSFNRIPPNIYLVSNGRKTRLDDPDACACLDYAEIRSVDVQIRPYNWEPGKVKAYLKNMYVEIEQDPLAAKWAQLEGPDNF